MVRLKRFAAAAAMVVLCAQAPAAVVRFDFTLSGMSASTAGGGDSVPGFGGTQGHGYVIFDTGNAKQVTNTGGAFGVSAEVGCSAYQDGVCQWSYGAEAPVVTDWSFVSVLATASKLHAGASSSSGVGREYLPYYSYTNSPLWFASLYDVQYRQDLRTDGITEWVSNGFSMNFQSTAAPLFDELMNLAEAPHVGGDIWAAMNLVNQVASWGPGHADYQSQGYSQNFWITSVTATSLDVPEPATAALLAVALLGAVGARRRVSRLSPQRP